MDSKPREKLAGREARQLKEIESGRCGQREHSRIQKHLWVLSVGSRYEKPMINRPYARSAVWWSWPGLNRRPRECHSRALPTALQPHPNQNGKKAEYTRKIKALRTRGHANTQIQASQESIG